MLLEQSVPYDTVAFNDLLSDPQHVQDEVTFCCYSVAMARWAL